MVDFLTVVFFFDDVFAAVFLIELVFLALETDFLAELVGEIQIVPVSSSWLSLYPFNVTAEPAAVVPTLAGRAKRCPTARV